MKIFLILFCLFVSVDAFAERKVDAGTVELKHQATPANPAAGYKRFYCKGDDECYFLNSAGTEQEILSGLVSLSSEITGVLGISNGGTNSSTALNNNRIMQSSGGAIVEATAITANRALISDSNGIPTHSSVTNTELGYVSGVTSGIQGQLDQPNIPQTSDSSTGNIDALSTATFNSIRLTGAAPVLRGIANGSDGKIITVTNASGVSVTVSNENANPSAANRIITGTAADLTLADSASIWLQYDSTSSRWRVIGGSGGGGSGVTDAVTKSIAQTGHGFAVGDVIRHNGTNYVDAQADSDSNAEVIGVVSAVADANNFTVTTSGFVSGLSGLTAGAAHFLSAATAGALTATEPSALGQVSKPVLIATSTTAGYVVHSRGYVVGGNSGSTLTGWTEISSPDITIPCAAGGQSKIFRRVIGDTLYVRGSFRCTTTVSTGNAKIDLSGYTIDLAKLTTYGFAMVGLFHVQQNANTQINNSLQSGHMFVDGSDNNTIWMATNVASLNYTYITNTTSILGTNEPMQIEFSVPIL